MKVIIQPRKDRPGRVRVSIQITEPSMTEQSHMKQANINTIMRKANMIGFESFARGIPTYGNFSGVEDFQTAVNQVMEAHEDFLNLPSEIRNRFRNDPAELIEFLADPANEQEAKDLGIIHDPDAEARKEGIPIGTPLPESDPAPPPTETE